MKRYSNKWRAIAWILMALFLIALVSIIFQGCSKGYSEGFSQSGKDVWALIKVNGGEPLHVQVVDWQCTSTGNIYIYTEDRMYVTSTVNVLLVENLKNGG